MRWLRYSTSLLIILLLSLTGCTENSNEDLKTFMQKTRHNIEPSPLPKIKKTASYEPIVFANPANKSPFQKPILKHKSRSIQSRPKRRAAQKRKHIPLERYPLAQLKLIGTVQQQDHLWGFVTSKDDNTVYTVKKGDSIGKYHGKITAIEPNKLMITEMIENASGLWQKKTTILKLQSADEKP